MRRQPIHQWIPCLVNRLMNKFTILQYNCGNANYRTARPWFEAVLPADHQVLASQEPGYNRVTKSTFCPRGYTLLYEALPTTKVCFMVSNIIHTAYWTHIQYGPYVASLQIKLNTTTITIINIYNPRGNGPRIQVWPAITEAFEAVQGEIILLGDFNTHHPLWGGPQVATEPQADHLRAATQARNLHLLTPAG